MTSEKVNIAGVLVDNISNSNTIKKINEIISSGQTKYIVTTYSEFVVFANHDEEYKKILNQAALSLPDGIGILWAAKFLSIPLNPNSLILNPIIALWQVVYTGAAIIFNPKLIRTVIIEQVTGSHLIWDVAKLASQNNYSLSLIGGENGVAELTAKKLLDRFPDLKINLSLSGTKFNDDLVTQISKSNSDILVIAYQPPRQEKWLAQNLVKLNVNVCMGLGGTFDYIAGKRTQAPRILHYIGLEWLWRLVTQPWRWKRMWNAVPVFIWTVYKFKIKQS